MTFELKLLTKAAIPAAISKAERYRLLEEPGEAESICLDVLAVDPGNHEASVMLLLALTDQFGGDRPDSARLAKEALQSLTDEYERAYYAGIISERQAKARLHMGPGGGSMAYELLCEAMSHYEKAEAIRPAGNDDPLLRWNACARLLMRSPDLGPAPEEQFEPYLE